jgi:hypothetical protein
MIQVRLNGGFFILPLQIFPDPKHSAGLTFGHIGVLPVVSVLLDKADVY